MNLTWRNSPAHHQYAAKNPGLPIQGRSSRAHQTALARFRSGHLRSMTFVQGVKSFFTYPCSLLASPAHLLDCWGISLRQLYEEQDLVCDTITRKGWFTSSSPSATGGRDVVYVKLVEAQGPPAGVVGCYTRAFGDGPRNFEPWSSDVDDTCPGPPSPNYHTTPTGGRFSSRQI
ncbi:uncharacterized protein TNCV_133481 [Trichonephila clavipes]|nr:uncharacterized protein TNCV_133481 [Trichonephila clavipes]